MPWQEVSPDYIPQVGDILKSVIRYENTGVVSANDQEIINRIESMSNKEIEDYVYEQTGVKVKVRNKTVRVVESGWKWDCDVEYEVVEAQTPGIIAVAIAIAVVIGMAIAFLVTLNWFVQSNAKYVESIIEDPFTRNAIAVVSGLAIFALILAMLKK